MAKEIQKSFVPKQTPPKRSWEVKRVETKIRTLECVEDDNNIPKEIKITFSNGTRHTIKRNDRYSYFLDIWYNAKEGDSVTLEAYASKILKVARNY